MMSSAGSQPVSGRKPIPGRMDRGIKRRTQEGFTLLEWLLAVSTGGLLVAAAMSLLLTSLHHLAAQERYSQTQDRLRFTSELLIRTLRFAGQHAHAQEMEGAMVLPADPSREWQERFVVRGAGMNCLGDRGLAVISEYSVQGGQLRCGNHSTVHAQPLVDGIRSLRIRAHDRTGQVNWEDPVGFQIRLEWEDAAGMRVVPGTGAMVGAATEATAYLEWFVVMRSRLLVP